MTVPPKRVALDFGSEVPARPAQLDPALVRQVAHSAGLRETPSLRAEPQPGIQPNVIRRPRRRTGRTEQFATRIKPETLQAIYDYADRHDITLAETIEIAVSRLIQKEGGPA